MQSQKLMIYLWQIYEFGNHLLRNFIYTVKYNEIFESYVLIYSQKLWYPQRLIDMPRPTSIVPPYIYNLSKY